jgi:hypothetical protein
MNNSIRRVFYVQLDVQQQQLFRNGFLVVDHYRHPGHLGFLLQWFVLRRLRM